MNPSHASAMSTLGAPTSTTPSGAIRGIDGHPVFDNENDPKRLILLKNQQSARCMGV
jgi:hypothetical protein